MVRAEYKDKELAVKILVNSFDENQSINYVVKQDSKRTQRIKQLMEYSFDICYLFGEILLSNDKKGCALILLPDKKKTTLKSAWLDVKFAITTLGLSDIKKAMNREAIIKKNHPEGLLFYLWFIGVDTSEQHKGIGSNLLKEVIETGLSQKRIVCLETSTLKNIPWYKKLGFQIYKELYFEYKLYCMKRE